MPGDSAVFAVPGLAYRQNDLHRAGVDVSVRGDHVRAAFHIYNSLTDVDRALEVLAG